LKRNVRKEKGPSGHLEGNHRGRRLKERDQRKKLYVTGIIGLKKRVGTGCWGTRNALKKRTTKTAKLKAPAPKRNWLSNTLWVCREKGKPNESNA